LDEARHLAREKYKQLKQVRKLAVTRIQQLEAELEATRS
jgi:hypothetical protein